MMHHAKAVHHPHIAKSLEIDSDKAKMQRFLLWAGENGAIFSSTRVKIEDGGSREIRASTPIANGNLVMHIPRRLMITTEVARASKIGKLIAENNANISDQGAIAAFLLEIKNEGGFWKPYIDILPEEFPNQPMLFNDVELAWLKGTWTVSSIRNQIEWVDYEYNQLKNFIPEGWSFTRDDYAWAKCTVMTRVHGVSVCDTPSIAMVPLADLPNHATDENVFWGKESTLGFIYIAAGRIEADTPLTITYGRKSNSLLYSVYGFCTEDNPKNDTRIELPAIGPDHPCHALTKDMGTLRDATRVFFVTTDCDDLAVRTLFAYLRLSTMEQAPASIETVYRAVSHQNETVALNMLRDACMQRMREFETTIEEDKALLDSGTLTYNQRCMVVVRKGEKEALQYYIDLANNALAVLESTSPTTRFSAYFKNALAGLSGTSS